MIRTLRILKNNWRKNHRHHGGFTAASRCLAGTLAIRAGLLPRGARDVEVSALTFSVVPWMTALWARLLRPALGGHDHEVLIGDCSGGIGRGHHGLVGGDARVIPCLNEHHGDKIDLFLARLCRAPYVLIADDDVFWLDARPLEWALAQLEADPRIGAVSLLPRYMVSDVLRQDDITQAMGSHCLVIRRELWQREQLAFAVVPAQPGQYWFYDTGDFANRELLRRGYRVAIADEDLGRHLAAFDGISAWILKLRGQQPDELAASIADIPARQGKAQQALYFAQGLAALLAERGLGPEEVAIVPATRLEAAERVLGSHLSARERDDIHRAVETKLDRVRDRLRDLESIAGGEAARA